MTEQPKPTLDSMAVPVMRWILSRIERVIPIALVPLPEGKV